MNLTVNEASLFVHRWDDLVGKRRGVEIVLAPTMLAVQPLHLQVQHHHFNLAAQNFYWRDHGAYTGEVSASQLRGLVQYAHPLASTPPPSWKAEFRALRGTTGAEIPARSTGLVATGARRRRSEQP